MRAALRPVLLWALLATLAAPLPAQEEVRTDAWGVRKRPVLAFIEIVGINVFTWSLNYYVRDEDFAVVYPKTWWNNISNGFEYDGNLFATNMIDHPYHGSTYFNAARSNGVGFWGAAPLTAIGSLMWECCGERHPMAFNDVVNTTFGGMALGEALYRTSSAVLSNEATGAARFGREFAALFLDPLRGFNRIISGRAFSVSPNPADPDDRTPGYFRLSLDGGYRGVNPDSDFRDDVTGGFFRFRIDYGSPFDGRRRGAFDVFEFDMSLYAGDQNVFGSLAVRGNLLTRDLSRSSSSAHVWSVVQTYEYDDNSAYQFGDQNVGLRLESLWGRAEGPTVSTRLQAGAILFGTLDSALRPVTDTPAGWDLRPFDYTTGLDGSFEIEAETGRLSGGVAWRSSWMQSLNHNSVNGGSARHWLHEGRVSAHVRLSPQLGVGGDFRVYLRDSSYDVAVFEDVRETVPELRLYGTWVLVPGRDGAAPAFY
ncbi:MAG: DUF3943 domain-containing protein [Candidatus Palauibacterales bacterium]|nr:DUF3943 domain-containing protein [Candidatus Palauibacterales bacterium]